MRSVSVVLSGAPALGPLLARGALLSPFKRPHPDAEFPRDRLVLPGLRIDLSRLAAYERVCGFATGDDALPLTYPHVLGFPLAMRLMSDRGFPLPLLGLVHTSVEITRRRTTAATGEYELAVYIGGLEPHRRGTEASVITEMRAEGDVVWESRSTYLARHRTQGRMPARASDEPEPLPAVAEWRLGGDIGRRYGAASGDRNPIHLHPSRPASSASPAPSRTECGRWPAASPPTGRPNEPGWRRSSGRRCCCRGA